MGDVDSDLFGFEQEVLSENVHKLAVEKKLVSITCVLLEESNCKYVREITNSEKEEVLQKLKQIILTIVQLNHTSRQTQLSLKTSVQILMNMAKKDGKDWKKSIFYCDKCPKTSQYEVSNCIGRALSVVDKIGYYTLTLNEK